MYGVYPHASPMGPAFIKAEEGPNDQNYSLLKSLISNQIEREGQECKLLKLLAESFSKMRQKEADLKK